MGLGSGGLGIEEFVKYPKVSIVYSVDPDSIVATALILNVLSAKEIDFEIAPFYEAQKPLDPSSLTLLVGVRQSKAIAGARIRLLQDFLGSKRFVALKTLNKLKDLWVVPSNSVAAALAATIASFKGSSYDPRVLEVAKAETVEFESSGIIAFVDETLRLFRYPEAKISECLFRTLEPFIPGISLSPSRCREVLGELGIADRVGVLEDNEKDKLVKYFVEVWESRSTKVPSLVGPKIAYRKSEGLDLYEVAYSMLAALDQGLQELVVASVINPKYIPALIAMLENMYSEIAKVIDAVFSGEVKPSRSYIRGLRLEILDLDVRVINTASKLLRSHGLASSTIVYRVSDGYCVPLSDVEPSWPWEEDVQIVAGAACSSSLDKIARLLI